MVFDFENLKLVKLKKEETATKLSYVATLESAEVTITISAPAFDGKIRDRFRIVLEELPQEQQKIR